MSEDADCKILFEGSKNFWRQRTTLDILIVEHVPHQCLEVIVYDPNLNMEAPRMYLGINEIDKCLSAAEINAHVAKLKEAEIRKHSTPNEARIREEVVASLRVRYVESKLIIADYDHDATRFNVTLMPPLDASAHGVTINLNAPSGLSPYNTRHWRKIHTDGIDDLIRELEEEHEKVQSLCEKAQRLERRALIRARWKLPLLAIYLQKTRASPTGPLPGIDDAYVQENTAFGANREEELKLKLRQELAAEKARLEGKVVHANHVHGLELKAGTVERQLTIEHLDDQTPEKKLAVQAAVAEAETAAAAAAAGDAVANAAGEAAPDAVEHRPRAPNALRQETEAAAVRRELIMKEYGLRAHPRSNGQAVSAPSSPKAALARGNSRSGNTSPRPPPSRGNSKHSVHSRGNKPKSPSGDKDPETPLTAAGSDRWPQEQPAPSNWEDEMHPLETSAHPQHDAHAAAGPIHQFVSSLLHWGKEKVVAGGSSGGSGEAGRADGAELDRRANMKRGDKPASPKRSQHVTRNARTLKRQNSTRSAAGNNSVRSQGSRSKTPPVRSTSQAAEMDMEPTAGG